MLIISQELYFDGVFFFTLSSFFDTYFLNPYRVVLVVFSCELYVERVKLTPYEYPINKFSQILSPVGETSIALIADTFIHQCGLSHLLHTLVKTKVINIKLHFICF